MLSGKQKYGTSGGIKKTALILSVILAIALAGSIVVNVYAAGQTDIFWKADYDMQLQNSRVLVDEELGITFFGTYKNVVKAYDKDGNELWSNDISGAVEAMAYDNERDWLIVGSQDRNVYVYQASDGAAINTFPINGRVYDLDYDQAGGRLLVSAGVSKTKHTLSILNIETGEELMKESLKNCVRSAKFMPDKQSIVYGSSRGRVTIIDMEGEKLAEEKARGEVYSIAVIAETGDIVALDEAGYVFRFNSALEQQFSVQLVGDGRTLGVSADGEWIVAGTREGDIYILDPGGKMQFSTRQEYDVSQIYFGEKRSFVVTLSENVYEFSADRLKTIGLMSAIREYSVWGIAGIAALLAAALIATFPASRALAVRFFKSVYKHRVAYLMLTPSIVLIMVFNYYNVFQAFYYAFTDWSLATKTMREVKFIGFDNFVKMITEGYFLLGVKNLLIMMVTSFLKLLTVPVLLAELVFAMRNRHGESSRRRYWFRLLLVMPMVVPGVVNTLMWKNIYDPNIGALNSFLEAVGLGNLKHAWLGDEATALWSIICMGFPWVNSFAFLVFYGGLINIPGELFEAAKVDGSTPMWNFFHIHIPLISPQLKMLIITTFIGAVQDYGGVYLLTQGGPGTATYVPGLELYYAATKFGQYGYACAMGLVMFIVILAGSLLNMRMKTQELN